MPRDRRDMTLRVVPLRSREAGDARVGGTIAERLKLLEELSAAQWALSQRPLPTYTRATIPIVLVPLRASDDAQSERRD